MLRLHGRTSISQTIETVRGQISAEKQNIVTSCALETIGTIIIEEDDLVEGDLVLKTPIKNND